MRSSRSSQHAEEASLSIMPRKASVHVTACLYRNSNLQHTSTHFDNGTDQQTYLGEQYLGVSLEWCKGPAVP